MSIKCFVRVSATLLMLATASSAMADSLVISEFRLRGPNGANDEYIEIYNQDATPHTVAATSGTGYGLAASDGVTRATIPNGTIIPAHGHFLITNPGSYSLGSYPSGNGTTATGDATYTTGINDNAGIALFNNNIVANYTLANRFDAVGSTSETNTLYKEGTGYPALTAFSIDYTFHRDPCGKAGSITTFGDCANAGTVKDTNNNAADFIFEDTNGTSAGAGQRLGSPGPENLTSPITFGTGLSAELLDTCASSIAAPNWVRDQTSAPGSNSTFGTLDLRQTFTNNTGSALTRLRFRIVDLTTFPAPSGFADLRPRTSTSVVATVDRPPCASGTSSITVQGSSLEQPPSQPNGGGFNSSMSVGAITFGAPLAAGASIDVRFLLGIQQTGRFKFALVPEGLPAAGIAGGALMFEGCTDGTCPTPTIDQAAGQTDPTSSSPVNFSVVFNRAVTGFDSTDVVIGGTAGATTAVVTGSGATYNVAVSGMTTSGTVTISLKSGAAQDSSNVPSVASINTDNSVTYNADSTPPSVTVEQAATQDDPTTTSPIHFTVTFSEPVTGFTDSDVVLGGTAGATTATVTGTGPTYDVAVTGMTTNGSVTASLNAGAAVDLANNPSLASTSNDNAVSYEGFDLIPPTVTVEQAATQDDPTTGTPIHFTVTFSEPVTGFDDSDVVIGGTAGATTAVVTPAPPFIPNASVYDVAVSGMIVNGTVTVSLNAGAAFDGGNNPSEASTSNDNAVSYEGFDVTPPTVTINQATGQADPAQTSPIHFTVVFSELVTGFDSSDVILSGTAGATTAVVTVAPNLGPVGATTYDVAVSGVTTNGTVIATIPAGAALDLSSNLSQGSTSTDNTVTFDGFDLSSPTVTVTLAAGQNASSASSTIHFTVVFSEPVTGFDASDVMLGGTAGATFAKVTGGPTIYDVAVSGMTKNGTVLITIAGGAAIDGSENASMPSTAGTDSTVAFTGIVSPTCGDGLVQPAAGEQCDDGNNVDDDGCTNCVFDNGGDGCGCSGAPDASSVAVFALMLGVLLAPRRRRRAA